MKMNKEKLMELKLAMDSDQIFSEEIETKRAEFEAANAELFERQKRNQEVIEECKSVLRENAEEGFKKDGEKKRLGGIGIRVMKQLEYDDAIALKWAKDKDMFLKLDKTSFDKVAKTGEIDFVKINEKVTVTFPKEITLEE